MKIFRQFRKKEFQQITETILLIIGSKIHLNIFNKVDKKLTGELATNAGRIDAVRILRHENVFVGFL